MKPPPKSPTSIVTSGLSFSSENDTMKLGRELMIKRAIRSGKKHGVTLLPGRFNLATGNCAFESAIYNVNDRNCFEAKFHLSVDYYRRIWATDMKNRTLNDDTWQIYSEKEWEAGWQEMMESEIYERGIFGDLMLFGIACGLKKVLLIFNTNLETPHDPIYVCDPRRFQVEPDSEIPVVLAYNMSHYESVHPADGSDEGKTISLVNQYLGGSYVFGRKDMPYLLIEDDDESPARASENESKQETEEVEDRKRKEKERKRDARAKRTDEEIEEEKERRKQSRKDNNEQKTKDAERKKKARMTTTKTDEELKIEKAKEAERIKKVRKAKNKTDEELKVEKVKEAERIKKVRKAKNKTDEELKIEKGKDVERKKKARKRQTKEEAEESKSKEAERKRKSRAMATDGETSKDNENRKKARTEKIPKSKFTARNAKNILSQEQIVKELVDTEECLESMNSICQFCKARKWKGETPSLCCNGGKVVLDSFPDPPDLLKKLLLKDDSE